MPDALRARPLLSTRLDRDDTTPLAAFDLRPAEGLLLTLHDEMTELPTDALPG